MFVQAASATAADNTTMPRTVVDVPTLRRIPVSARNILKVYPFLSISRFDHTVSCQMKLVGVGRPQMRYCAPR